MIKFVIDLYKSNKYILFEWYYDLYEKQQYDINTFFKKFVFDENKIVFNGDILLIDNNIDDEKHANIICLINMLACVCEYFDAKIKLSKLKNLNTYEKYYNIFLKACGEFKPEIYVITNDIVDAKIYDILRFIQKPKKKDEAYEDYEDNDEYNSNSYEIYILFYKIYVYIYTLLKLKTEYILHRKLQDEDFDNDILIILKYLYYNYISALDTIIGSYEVPVNILKNLTEKVFRIKFEPIIPPLQQKINLQDLNKLPSRNRSISRNTSPLINLPSQSSHPLQQRTPLKLKPLPPRNKLPSTNQQPTNQTHPSPPTNPHGGGNKTLYVYFKTKNGKRIKKRIYNINNQQKVRDGKLKNNEPKYVTVQTYKKKYALS